MRKRFHKYRSNKHESENVFKSLHFVAVVSMEKALLMKAFSGYNVGQER